MRLKSIKLAGFKSFVDPTTVGLPSNLCAIVGPNGCGKSNIIDAVRWVMGESSAKNLRGESMTDVIFNGSGGRKPVGQASIELVFDNSDGTVGGEYAAFSEISVKRKVTRESQNIYYLNGQKCRRRDITDIFLGTGLGPRSYAIIEQGMISRLIESKPEELRVFIEEAAGISKYKERRRETENRMRRTLENLERLTDIREELERQLQHLQRQAQSAEKYTEFKKQERLLKAQLQAMQWRDLDKSVSERADEIAKIEMQVEAALAKQTSFELQNEQLFTQQSDFREAFNEVQGRFYAIGAEIARTEQNIKNQQQRFQTLHQELEQIAHNCSQTERLIQEDKERQEQWQMQLEEVLPELELLTETEEGSQEMLMQAEETMGQWQQTWDEFNNKAATARQQAEVQQSRIQHSDTVISRLDERIRRFDEELKNLHAGPVEEEINELLEQLAELDLEQEQQQETLQNLLDAIAQMREQQSEKREDLDSVSAQIQTHKGRLSSLEALQQAALNQEDDGINQWLEQQGLSNNPRLAEKIAIKPGYEKALETVLSDKLQAVCVDDITAFAQGLSALEKGSVQLLQTTEKEDPANTQFELPSLLSLCENPNYLNAALAGVYVAESFEKALAHKAKLQAHESIICQEGLWLGRDWLRIQHGDENNQGLLKRGQEIEQLQQTLQQQEQQKAKLQDELAELKQQLQDHEQAREQAQTAVNQLGKKQSELGSVLSGKKVKIEQLAERKRSLGEDLEEAKEQMQIEQEGLQEARAILQQAIDAMEKDNEQREELIAKRDDIRHQLEEARQRARHDKDRSHQLAMQEQSLKTQIAGVEQSIERTAAQFEQQIERRGQLEMELADNSEANENSESALELEALLDKRLVVEQELASARANMQGLEEDMRVVERERTAVQHEINELRTKLEQSRLASQTWQVQRENLQKRIQEADFDVAEIIAELPEGANESEWQQEIERVANRISRLGAINLAAIDEYQQASERKTYLDAQNDDLQEAIVTLENAIRKIDKETRMRFKDTFDKINGGVQELFPKVFGGGRAYLEMTGDDLLSTGVAIMAQPPGKRNSTIHLLSGGEKALTAIALVFSIFKLNPAPFCILDEVDAPLDDANVGRYARLVKEMSKQVQFIYITHNKIAMEMAEQLLGVTMHEPGCSRLVTVDVNEAAELAAS